MIPPSLTLKAMAKLNKGKRVPMITEKRDLMERTEENCIRTYTGKKFWPMDAREEDICIEDIAKALSQKCRYTGHSCFFYSVAQHCVHASEYCEDPRWALMHDAAEAYLPDVSRPIKPMIHGFVEAEDKLLRVIASKFGLEFPIPDSVHQVDDRLLVTEWHYLMPAATSPGSKYQKIERLDLCIRPCFPSLAEYYFLKRFHDLFPNYKDQNIG